MNGLKYTYLYIFQSSSRFLLLFTLFCLIACQNSTPKSVDYSMLYPSWAKTSYQKAQYDSAKWAFYREYATIDIFLEKTAKNSHWDTTGLPKRFDLITCDVDTLSYCCALARDYSEKRGSKDTLELNFCFRCESHSLCSDPVIHRDLPSNTYYIHSVYLAKNKVLGAGLNMVILDSTLTRRQLITKDSVFKSRLQKLNVNLPLWLQKEALKRGFLIK